MTVRVYSSEDANAPVLTGAVGSLIALLDACLVNGYTGKTAAGWAKSFTGTNLAVYAPVKLAHESQPYYRFDDTVTTYANVAGFRNMSDVNTGDFRFPVIGTNRYVLKTDTAGASPRRWKIIADNRTVFLFIQPTISDDWEYTHFGAFTSFRPNDVCPFVLEASTSTTVYSLNYGLQVNTDMTFYGAPTPVAIGYSGKGNSITAGKHTDGAKSGIYNYNIASTGYNLGRAFHASYVMQNINPADGAIHFAPVWIHEPTRVLRGIMRGLWNPLGDLPISDAQTITGAANLTGKTLLGFTCKHNTTQAQVAIEISDTWS